MQYMHATWSGTVDNRLANLTIRQLTELYNSIAESPVSKFRDHVTSVARLQSAMDRLGYELYQPEDGIWALRVGSTEVDEREDAEAAKAPTEAPAAVTAVSDGTAAAPSRKAADPGATKRSHAPNVSRMAGKTIHVATKDGKNPKLAGSAAWKRFELYIQNPGLSTETYEKLVVEGNLGARRDVMRDLVWDSGKNFILLQETSTPTTQEA